MVRIRRVGCCYGILSERPLGEVHLNLAHRGFCRLGLEDEAPNLSTWWRTWSNATHATPVDGEPAHWTLRSARWRGAS